MGKKELLKEYTAAEKEVKLAAKKKARIISKSVCNWSFLWMSCKTIGLILLYYSCSISLTFYNQRFIHAFNFPLSITLFHLVIKFIMATSVRVLWECKTGNDRVNLTWWLYFSRVGPPGLFSSLDIGLSNWSFEFITVSLYTMTKSTVIVFILFFSILFKLEKMRYWLVFVVLFIASGLFMFTYKSTQFNLEGFLMVLGASFISGLRWALAQMVLQKSELGLTNPLDMMYHIQPWMILSLLPLSAAFEGIHVATTVQAFGFEQPSILFRNFGLLMIGASIAFIMEFSEFLLVARTSGLTLSIAGIFKEICTLLLAIFINHDHLSLLNGFGLVTCLLGIILHVISKAINNQKESAKSTTANGSADVEGTKSLLCEASSEEDIFNSLPVR